MIKSFIESMTTADYVVYIGTLVSSIFTEQNILALATIVFTVFKCLTTYEDWRKKRKERLGK